VGELLLVDVFGGPVGKHCRRRQANSLASGAVHQALERRCSSAGGVHAAARAPGEVGYLGGGSEGSSFAESLTS
jgi:hypothetical protein